MFHSISQQLIRQDPAYYILYTVLYLDKQWQLVLYPYYVKFVVEGDSTYFHYINVNIPDLLIHTYSSSQIQETVLLDNKTEDNCTVLLPRIHKKL